MIDSRPHLEEASLNDYPVIQNMARFYVYDMSRYCGHEPGWECPNDGLYECIDLKSYFTDKGRFAFFIKVGQEKAGFALINKVGTSPDVDWNMGEFFILAKFQNSGLGKTILKDIFNRFLGIWEIACMPKNLGALAFWRKTLSPFKNGKAFEQEKIIDHPTPHPMVVFRFKIS